MGSTGTCECEPVDDVQCSACQENVEMDWDAGGERGLVGHPLQGSKSITKNEDVPLLLMVMI